MGNDLQAAAVDRLRIRINTIMLTEPADEGTLKTALDAVYAESLGLKGDIYKQILNEFGQSHNDLGGQLVPGTVGSGLTRTTNGTGYSVGDIMTVDGSTSGSGGAVRVTAIGTVGTADTVAVNAAGTGYTEDDILTVTSASGTGLTVKVTGETAGAVDTIEIVTAGTGMTGDTTGGAVTGGSGGDDCTIDVDAYEDVGEIDTFEIWMVGDNYIGTLTVDTTGVGGADCVLVVDAATYEGNAVLDALIATVDALGTASAIVQGDVAGTTGYTTGDVLEVVGSGGARITIEATAGVVDGITSIDVVGGDMTANLDEALATVVSATGTPDGLATFDVTATLI